MQTLSELLNTRPFLLAGEPDFLARLIKNLPPSPVVLEIGTFRGLTAVLMARQRKDVKIITIDPHTGIPNSPALYSNPYIVESNAKKYNVSEQITHYPLSSADYYPKENFDLLFIDGNHDFEWVSHDYHKFEQYVKPEGFIVFHDVDNNHKGPLKFCSKLIPKCTYKSMFVVKKKDS